MNKQLMNPPSTWQLFWRYKLDELQTVWRVVFWFILKVVPIMISAIFAFVFVAYIICCYPQRIPVWVSILFGIDVFVWFCIWIGCNWRKASKEAKALKEQLTK